LSPFIAADFLSWPYSPPVVTTWLTRDELLPPKGRTPQRSVNDDTKATGALCMLDQVGADVMVFGVALSTKQSQPNPQCQCVPNLTSVVAQHDL